LVEEPETFFDVITAFIARYRFSIDYNFGLDAAYDHDVRLIRDYFNSINNKSVKYAFLYTCIYKNFQDNEEVEAFFGSRPKLVVDDIEPAVENCIENIKNAIRHTILKDTKWKFDRSISITCRFYVFSMESFCRLFRF
jgi:hypothetical protein